MKKIFFTLAALLLVTGIIAQERVYTPTLKTPLNNAVKQMPNVILSWNAVTGSLNLQYELQFDTSANFNSPLLVTHTQTLITGYQTSKLLFATKYFWRVRAIDGETSDWSTVWNFTVFDKVELSKPVANAQNQEPNVSLEWKTTIAGNAITGVDTYEWQADTSQNFNSPQFRSGQTTSTVFTSPMSSLLFGMKYYWRVRAAHSASISSWTDVANFTVISVVTQQSPNNNATNQMVNALMKWKAIGGVLSYVYQISHDAAFTDLIVEAEVDTNVANASFLMFGEKYYWRVKARHLNDTTAWQAEPFNFTTINTVLLKSPAKDQTGVAFKPTMQWTEQTGIVGYQLQVASENTFAEPYISVTLDPDVTSYVLNKALNPNSAYYWRMRAYTDGGLLADTTAWSEAWKFTTTYGTGIEDGKGTAFSVYPNPAVEKVSLKIYTPGNEDGNITILDFLGRTVIDMPVKFQAGTNVKEISVASLPKGAYIIRIVMGAQTLNQKLVIEK